MVVTMAMQSVLIPTEIYVTRGVDRRKTDNAIEKRQKRQKDKQQFTKHYTQS